MSYLIMFDGHLKYKIVDTKDKKDIPTAVCKCDSWDIAVDRCYALNEETKKGSFMINFFYKLFNHDKIDDLSRTLDIYKERNEQLEYEVKEYKGYKLKFEVTKLYVDDDEGLLELFELAKNADEYKRRLQDDGLFGSQAAMQQLAAGRANAGYGPASAVDILAKTSQLQSALSVGFYQ